MHIKNHHISLNIQQHMMLPSMRSNCKKVMRHCMFFCLLTVITLSIRDPITSVIPHHIIFADHYVIFGNSLRTTREVAEIRCFPPILTFFSVHQKWIRLVVTHHQLHISRHDNDMSCCIFINLSIRSSQKRKSFKRKRFLIR